MKLANLPAKLIAILYSRYKKQGAIEFDLIVLAPSQKLITSRITLGKYLCNRINMKHSGKP